MVANNTLTFKMVANNTFTFITILSTFIIVAKNTFTFFSSESVASVFNLVGLLVSPAPTKITFTATAAPEGVSCHRCSYKWIFLISQLTGHSNHQCDRLPWNSSESVLPGYGVDANGWVKMCLRWTAPHLLLFGGRIHWHQGTPMESLMDPQLGKKISLDFSPDGIL